MLFLDKHNPCCSIQSDALGPRSPTTIFVIPKTVHRSVFTSCVRKPFKPTLTRHRAVSCRAVPRHKCLVTGGLFLTSVVHRTARRRSMYAEHAIWAFWGARAARVRARVRVCESGPAREDGDGGGELYNGCLPSFVMAAAAVVAMVLAVERVTFSHGRRDSPVRLV